MLSVTLLCLMLTLCSTDGKGHLGCFLSAMTNITSGHSMPNCQMTPAKCINYCKIERYKYANIEDSSKCICANAINPNARLSHGNCNVGCSGNKHILCGGVNAMSSYETGYMGCYTDYTTRTLTGAYYLEIGTNTIDICIAYCKERFYTYAGVQYRSACFCGDSYSKAKKRPEKECNFGCSGNGKQICGAAWRHNIYNTGTNYIGCFKETKGLNLSGPSIDHPKMTNNMCLEWCKNQGYILAGTKNGTKCSCGNGFRETDVIKQSRSACKKACGGNSCQKCGGVSNISIFNTESNNF